MNQRGEDQTSIASSPTLPHGFGSAVANDWIIREGPAVNTNIVARVRGITVGSGKIDENWLFCHSILFTDTRFNFYHSSFRNFWHFLFSSQVILGFIFMVCC